MTLSPMSAGNNALAVRKTNMKRSKVVEKEVAEAKAEKAAEANVESVPAVKAKKGSKSGSFAKKPVGRSVADKIAETHPDAVTELMKAGEKRAKADKAAAKAPKKGKAATKAVKKATTPQVRHPKIFGCSVASVIRALAVAGMETAKIVKVIQTREPEAKRTGIESSIYEGKKGIFAPAQLTEKQLATLTAEAA